MNKKPKVSEKYKGVKKTIDTGNTIKDVQVLSDKYVSKRKNEYFKRIKGSTIVKLLGENNNKESIYNLADENNGEMAFNQIDDDKDNTTSKSVLTGKKSENQSVYTAQTNNTAMTSKTGMTAVTYATEMLGELVSSR